MGGWVILCDAKKPNLKYRFLKSKKLFDVVNRNKHKYLTTKKQIIFFLIYNHNHICDPVTYQKSFCWRFRFRKQCIWCFLTKACFQNKKIRLSILKNFRHGRAPFKKVSGCRLATLLNAPSSVLFKLFCETFQSSPD